MAEVSAKAVFIFTSNGVASMQSIYKKIHDSYKRQSMLAERQSKKDGATHDRSYRVTTYDTNLEPIIN